MIRRIRHNIGVKAIAMAVLCLFLFNQIALAYPDTLAVQGLQNPETRDEILAEMQRRHDSETGGDEDLAQPVFEGEGSPARPRAHPRVMLTMKITRRTSNRSILEQISEFALRLGDKHRINTADIENVLAELALNVKYHGNGGVIEVFVEKNTKGKIARLSIISEDNGPGLPRNPNELVRIGRDEASGESGVGFMPICLDPSSITIEYNGEKWRRISDNRNADTWFVKEDAPSEVMHGTRFSIGFDFEEPELPSGIGAHWVHQRAYELFEQGKYDEAVSECVSIVATGVGDEVRNDVAEILKAIIAREPKTARVIAARLAGVVASEGKQKSLIEDIDVVQDCFDVAESLGTDVWAFFVEKLEEGGIFIEEKEPEAVPAIIEAGAVQEPFTPSRRDALKAAAFIGALLALGKGERALEAAESLTLSDLQTANYTSASQAIESVLTLVDGEAKTEDEQAFRTKITYQLMATAVHESNLEQRHQGRWVRTRAGRVYVMFTNGAKGLWQIEPPTANDFIHNVLKVMDEERAIAEAKAKAKEEAEKKAKEAPKQAESLAAAVQEAPKAEEIVHIVQPGDTLIRIARRYYGDAAGRRWQAIARHNNLDERAIRSLQLGQQIKLPSLTTVSAQAAVPKEKPEENVYTVVRGDSIASIAEKHFKTSSPCVCSYILEFNGLSSAALKVGQKIKIPPLKIEYKLQTALAGLAGLTREQLLAKSQSELGELLASNDTFSCFLARIIYRTRRMIFERTPAEAAIRSLPTRKQISDDLAKTLGRQPTEEEINKAVETRFVRRSAQIWHETYNLSERDVAEKKEQYVARARQPRFGLSRYIATILFALTASLFNAASADVADADLAQEPPAAVAPASVSYGNAPITVAEGLPAEKSIQPETMLAQAPDGASITETISLIRSINREHMARRADLNPARLQIIIPEELLGDYADRLKAEIASGQIELSDDIIIVPMEEASRLAADETQGPDRLIILNQKLAEHWKIVGKRSQAGKIVLLNYNFAYLEGAVALARAIQTGDEELIHYFYSILTQQDPEDINVDEVIDRILEGRLDVFLPPIDIPKLPEEAEQYRRLQEEAYEFLKKA